MAKRPAAQTPPSMLAVSVILVLLSASGMLAGIVTHQIQNAPASSPVAQATVPGHSTVTPTATALPTATTSSVTPSAGTGGSSSQFTLSVAAAPKSVSPGQSIAITVTVVQKGTQTPLPGIQCFLRPPTGGGQSLLMQYPPAVVSDVNGQASWQVTVPAQAPGTYRVEAVAYGPHGYNYFSYTDIVVAG